MKPKTKKPRISPPSSQYLDPTHQEIHEKYYAKKKVISERYIDYESFPKYPIAQCFSGKNMIKSLLHVRGSAPITPVLLFYSQIHNLSVEDQSFDTYIEGKVHKITPQVIASLLGLDRPLEPVSFPPANENELVVSKDEFRRAVYLPEHVDSKGRHRNIEVKVSQLKPAIAVLVKIFQSNILPSLSCHYYTNLDSIYLSFLLLNGYQVDMSCVIWHTMARVAEIRYSTKSVPYGIIVGQLLSYLGHPFPADTPCTTVPATFSVKCFRRMRLPYDTCDSNDRPSSEPHSNNISPPPPPSSTDANDASELPQTLPNDPPREFVWESIQLLKETMEEIFSHIVTRQDLLENQQQEIIDRFALEDDRRKNQYEDFLQQKKMIEHIAHQQNHLQQQHEEFAQRQKLIIDGIVTRQQHFEQQRQEMIDRIARRDDCLELQQETTVGHSSHQQDHLQQQQEMFMQQETTIGHNAHHQDHLQQQHEESSQQEKLVIDGIVTRLDHFEQQQQEMIDRVPRQDDCLEQQQQVMVDRIEQQHEEFAQLGKMSDRIASEQDFLELRIEEVTQQPKIIDHLVTQPDCCEQENPEMIGINARKHDYPARCKDQHHALTMQRTYPDQQVNPICQECGESGKHIYCLYKITKNGDDEIIWTCEDCDQTAELERCQAVQVTSSKEVIEDRSDSGKHLKY
ncbi:hypothetical protein MKW94_008920 [Papaver nudicaule]|uniref:Uncharacterized protein n=1 Tax=Papaver nudicaule TaxID=74823 RepID=A0AA41SIQ1_PAPNU|nr:hypothetical protein [Papaver nudicaule]